jgi:hypothetical protein
MVALLSAFKDALLPRHFNEAMMDIRAGEPGVAFESLCQWLYEDEDWSTGRIPRLSMERYRELVSLGRSMGLDESNWAMITPAP